MRAKVGLAMAVLAMAAAPASAWADPPGTSGWASASPQPGATPGSGPQVMIDRDATLGRLAALSSQLAAIEQLVGRRTGGDPIKAALRAAQAAARDLDRQVRQAPAILLPGQQPPQTYPLPTPQPPGYYPPPQPYPPPQQPFRRRPRPATTRRPAPSPPRLPRSDATTMTAARRPCPTRSSPRSPAPWPTRPSPRTSWRCCARAPRPTTSSSAR